MKLVFKFLGAVWAAAFFSFIGLTFYKNSGAELPPSASEYLVNFQKALDWLMSPELFLVVFPCMWFGTCFYLGKVSGWQRIAEKYAGNFQVDPAASFHGTSGRVGEIRHNGSLKIFADNKGIYLEVFFPFKFGHKDLFIPWQDISRITRVEGLSDSKLAGILNKIGGVFSSSIYIDLKLAHFREQKLIIQISEDLKRVLPKNLLDPV